MPDNTAKYLPYDSTDRQILVDLMIEYSTKLIAICNLELNERSLLRILAGVFNRKGSLERSKNARSIADSLEKVMRVTVEIQDQIETNIARKLELDCRIADASAALELYYSIFKT
jgi:hypothetical protein